MDILNNIDFSQGSYKSVEGNASTVNKGIIDNFKKETSSVKNIPVTIQKLYVIKNLMKDNRQKVQEKIDNLNKSESTIKKLKQELTEDDTIQVLSQQNINRDIYDIATVEFSLYYSKINEFNYKLKVIAYQRTMFKQKLNEINTEMEKVQNYIDALE